MMWLIRVRLHVAVVLIQVFVLILIIASGQRVMPLPAVHEISVSLALYLPCVLAGTVTASVAMAPFSQEALSPRRIERYVVGLVAAQLLMLCVLLAITLVYDPYRFLIAVRGLAAYTGIGLLAIPLLGNAAPATPIVAASLLVLGSSPASPPIVSWVVSAQVSAQTWLAPATLLALGAVAWLWHLNVGKPQYDS